MRRSLCLIIIQLLISKTICEYKFGMEGKRFLVLVKSTNYESNYESTMNLSPMSLVARCLISQLMRSL